MYDILTSIISPLTGFILAGIIITSMYIPVVMLPRTVLLGWRTRSLVLQGYILSIMGFLGVALIFQSAIDNPGTWSFLHLFVVIASSGVIAYIIRNTLSARSFRRGKGEI